VLPELFNFLLTTHFLVVEWIVIPDTGCHAVVTHFVVSVVSDDYIAHFLFLFDLLLNIAVIGGGLSGTTTLKKIEHHQPNYYQK
jgi:hypothetical protein